MLTEEQITFFETQGYLVVSGLFSRNEVDFFKAHYEDMRLRESVGPSQSLKATTFEESDPLLTYPRLMQPHRRDEASLQWLIDARLNQCMTEMLGTEPFAVQTMFYFKPPGARGQALHLSLIHI